MDEENKGGRGGGTLARVPRPQDLAVVLVLGVGSELGGVLDLGP
jgi:hypothetical protein